jgi:hypothetical protein
MKGTYRYALLTIVAIFCLAASGCGEGSLSPGMYEATATPESADAAAPAEDAVQQPAAEEAAQTSCNEARIRYIMADFTFLGSEEYYPERRDETEVAEAIRRLEAGIQVMNLGSFERRVVGSKGIQVVYAGTDQTINGMDVQLSVSLPPGCQALVAENPPAPVAEEPIRGMCNNAYWPIVLGATWDYTVARAGETFDYHVNVWNASARADGSGGSFSTRESCGNHEFCGRGETPVDYYCDATGTFLVTGSMVIPPENQIVDGGVWPQDGYSLKVFGFENRTVPAGTFNAAMLGIIPAPPGVDDYAKGVGLIYRSVEPNTEMQLVSYNIPGYEGQSAADQVNQAHAAQQPAQQLSCEGALQSRLQGANAATALRRAQLYFDIPPAAGQPDEGYIDRGQHAILVTRYPPRCWDGRLWWAVEVGTINAADPLHYRATDAWAAESDDGGYLLEPAGSAGQAQPQQPQPQPVQPPEPSQPSESISLDLTGYISFGDVFVRGTVQNGKGPFILDWGDGTPPETIAAFSPQGEHHVYLKNGLHPLTVTDSGTGYQTTYQVKAYVAYEVIAVKIVNTDCHDVDVWLDGYNHTLPWRGTISLDVEHGAHNVYACIHGTTTCTVPSNLSIEGYADVGANYTLTIGQIAGCN